MPSTYPKLKKADKDKILDKLVLDTICYSLDADDSLRYIKDRTGIKLSIAKFYKIRQNVNNGQANQLWLSQFAKSGFAVAHQEMYETERNSLLDTNHQIFHLTNGIDREQRIGTREDQIIKLKYLQIQQINKIQNLLLSTPVIAQIKSLVRKELIERERERLTNEEGLSIEDANETIIKEMLEESKYTKNKLLLTTDTIINKSSSQNEDKSKTTTNRTTDNPEDTIGNGSDSEESEERSISDLNTEEFNKITDKFNKEKRDFIG